MIIRRDVCGKRAENYAKVLTNNNIIVAHTYTSMYPQRPDGGRHVENRALICSFIQSYFAVL